MEILEGFRFICTEIMPLLGFSKLLCSFSAPLAIFHNKFSALIPVSSPTDDQNMIINKSIKRMIPITYSNTKQNQKFPSRNNMRGRHGLDIQRL